MRTAIVSTYPPRACGIGTFAADVRATLLGVPDVERVDLVAVVNEPSSPQRRGLLATIAQAVRRDYVRTARMLGRLASIERYGIVRHPEDKNAALLPTGSAAAACSSTARRPSSEAPTARSSSPAPTTSSAGARPSRCSSPAAGACWDSLRIGLGPPPLRTEHGWLLVYHGVEETVGGDIYRVGLALLDLDEPTRVLRRLPGWILAPLAPYERSGDVPNVVFPGGLLHDPASDELRLCYGAADSSVCLAGARLRDVLDVVLAAPAGPEPRQGADPTPKSVRLELLASRTSSRVGGLRARAGTLCRAGQIQRTPLRRPERWSSIVEGDEARLNRGRCR